MEFIRTFFLFAISLVLICGCAPKPEGSADASANGTTANADNPNATSGQAMGSQPNIGGSGNSGGVAPMGGLGAGPMTPVSGSESLQGGGSGVGQVAKDKAREVAASSPSSVGNAMSEDGQ